MTTPHTLLQVTLPHPDKRLSPNAKLPHNPAVAAKINAIRIAAKQKARKLAADTTLDTLHKAQVATLDPPPNVVGLVWYYIGRRPDYDNTIAWTKHYLDGICDAIGIDDNTLELAYVRRVKNRAYKGYLTFDFYRIEDFADPTQPLIL